MAKCIAIFRFLLKMLVSNALVKKWWNTANENLAKQNLV